MRRYIVHYNQHYKGTQFAGFDLTNQTTNVGFTKITLDEFNTIEFNDEDLVILPLFTMHNCNESTTLLNGFIKKYINSKNYNREKTIVILGTPREPINKFNLTLNRQFKVEEASHTQVSFFKTFSDIGKQNQRPKVVVGAEYSDNLFMPMQNAPNKRVSSLRVIGVTAHSFLQTANESYIKEPGERDMNSQVYFDDSTDVNYVSSGEIFEQNLNKNKNRDYLFTMLSRSAKPDRFINFYNSHRYDVFNKGMVSYHNFDGVPKSEMLDFFENQSIVPTLDFLKFYDEWYHADDISIDNYDINDNLAFNLVSSHYLDSYIQVVGESFIGNKFVFISEKLWKTIACGSPFFVIGNKHTIDMLQQMGFKTFNKFWDESYDSLDSYWERSKKVFFELNKLSKLSKKELNKLIKDMEETIVHNRENLLRLIKQDNYVMDILEWITNQVER